MEWMEDLEQDALSRHIPVMQREGLEYMINVLNERKAEKVLEIGSAIGYSAMMMCKNVPGLTVETIERDDAAYAEAIDNLKTYGYEDRVIIHHADALIIDNAELREGPYDLLFIDAAKAQYRKFFEKYMPLVKDDGCVIVDNLDFHGMVDDIEHIQRRQTRQLVKKIKMFRDWILNNDDYNATYIPAGDGLCLITRKEKS